MNVTTLIGLKWHTWNQSKHEEYVFGCRTSQGTLLMKIQLKCIFLVLNELRVVEAFGRRTETEITGHDNKFTNSSNL